MILSANNEFIVSLPILYFPFFPFIVLARTFLTMLNSNNDGGGILTVTRLKVTISKIPPLCIIICCRILVMIFTQLSSELAKSSSYIGAGFW